MRQGYKSENILDKDGNPSGGYVKGNGIDIQWQNGPLRRDGDTFKPNGAFTEDVIHSVKNRLEYFNESKFKCRENAMAITKLDEALMWLDNRTREREARGVEGTHSI